MSLWTINQRLNLVSKFLHDRGLRERVVAELRRTFDSQRLVQRFSMGRGDADDLLSLFRTIEATYDLAGLLHYRVEAPEVELQGDDASWTHSLRNLGGRLDLEKPVKLASRIAHAIDEEGLIQSQRREEDDKADLVSKSKELSGKVEVEAQDGLSEASHFERSSAPPTNSGSDDVEAWIMRRT